MTTTRPQASSANLLQIQAGRKTFGGRVLFDDVTFAVNQGEHVGVIGPNGAGKTTLFKSLNLELELDQGEIIRSRSLRLGYLSQHDDWIQGETGNQRLERLSTIPTWDAKDRARDLDLSEAILNRPVQELSGGYRMRIKLLCLLGADPNLLLLDEPTNYLDLETTLILERFLQGFDGAFLLISHDREFLRRTTDHILEVEGGDVVKYPGSLDDYFESKELLRSQLLASQASQLEKRKQVLDFVARFGAKATKAKQAQSRMKQLEKMEMVEVKPLPVRARIRVPKAEPCGKEIFNLERVSIGYGGKPVLSELEFRVQRQDHVAVVGLNGQGKSTLLKSLAGRLLPIEGRLKTDSRARIGYFHQHVGEELNPNLTIEDSLFEVCDLSVTRQEIMDLAGSLLFSGDDIRKKIAVLSGGEKARVTLARLLLMRPSCLLLDEPTNHLDFDTVEALTQALRSYDGAVVAVSHDRGFIARIATRILEVDNGKVSLYPGAYDDYVWSLSQKLGHETGRDDFSAAAATGAAGVASGSKRSAPASQRESSQKTNSAGGSDLKLSLSKGQLAKEASKKERALKRQLEKVEAEIEQLRQDVDSLNQQLVQNDSSLSFSEKQTLILDLGVKGDHLIKLEEEWLNLSSELESIAQTSS